MALFKKDPPRACPKCGKADGWHILDNESSAVDYGDSFDVGKIKAVFPVALYAAIFCINIPYCKRKRR